jgi:hypothetical protein
MRPQPLISVTDVPRSSRWYQELLGCDSGHGGEEYERLLHDEALVLQLHRFEVGHHHGNCTLTWYDPRTATRRLIESSGYAIRTATSWSSSAPTASPRGRIRGCSAAWSPP